MVCIISLLSRGCLFAHPNVTAPLASANGRATGYFLAQHKGRLGGDKYISKITVFLTEREANAADRMNILFWVDDVPSPPPEMTDPDDDEMNTGPGRRDARVIKRSGDGKSIMREHVVWT